MKAAERAWYWAAGVLEGVGHRNTVAFVHHGYVICERWEYYDQSWQTVHRPLTDFVEKDDPCTCLRVGGGPPWPTDEYAKPCSKCGLLVMSQSGLLEREDEYWARLEGRPRT